MARASRRLFRTRFFSDGPGRAFGDELYQLQEDPPTRALDNELTHLLSRLER